MAKNQLDPKDVESLGQLRDELKIHAHLLKADLKEEWQKIEGQWQKLHGQLAPMKHAAEESADEVRAATELLFKAVKEGYQKIKSRIPV